MSATFELFCVYMLSNLKRRNMLLWMSRKHFSKFERRGIFFPLSFLVLLDISSSSFYMKPGCSTCKCWFTICCIQLMELSYKQCHLGKLVSKGAAWMWPDSLQTREGSALASPNLSAQGLPWIEPACASLLLLLYSYQGPQVLQDQ